MRVDLLTREYPPEVYGGAGVHVAELVRALRRDLEVVVRCFGAPRDEPGTFGYATPAEFDGRNPALGTMGVDLLMAGDAAGIVRTPVRARTAERRSGRTTKGCRSAWTRSVGAP